jgi:hypothetical protein
MSTLKLSGITSGSSILKAPDTGSTGVTFTLPASTGTLIADTSTLDATKLTGALPAISGASLTGITTDTTTIENNIAMLAFFRASDNSVSKYSLVDQVVDEYVDATGIDAGASTNENLASGVYSGGVVVSTSSVVSLAASNFSHSVVSSWNATIVASAATNSGSTGFHTDTSAVGSWVMCDFGAGNDKALYSWEYFIGIGVYATWQVQYSDDNSTWSSGVGSVFGGNPTSSSTWFTSGVITKGDTHRYWRTYKTNAASGGQYHFGAKLTAWDADTVSNLTLQSVATTAESAPTTGDIVILIEDSTGTATINTDIKAYISRDGSAFSSAVTLTDEGDWGTNKRILAAHDVDLSGITSGTAMKYKILTLNQSVGSKYTKIHATSLAWA